jgi:Nif-specific regulatory protein
MLEMLSAITRRVNESSRLDEILGPALRLLAEQSGLLRATLALRVQHSDELRVVASHGLTPLEVQRAHYRLGEGIVGVVAQTGQSRGVLKISSAPDYVDWTGLTQSGKDPSFACVPICDPGGVLGALGAYRLEASKAQLREDLFALEVVAGLIAPLIRREADDYLDRHAPGETVSEGRYKPSNIIGNSKPMRAVYDLIMQVASGPTTVLIRGESGVGKEVVAQAIHNQSDRARGAFVKVNCAALPEGIIESELFGHERGAFTSAVRERKGRFERARGGTIFLDEIGDLSPATQVKLLRVLQEREFERVGGNEMIKADVRVITATSRPLEEMIQQDIFRSDLYYRLNVFPVWLPALRERRADILLLADHFIELFNRSHGKRVRRLSTSAIDMLMAYHWPGNVRELENCMERAVLLARDDVILGHHLPPSLQTAEASGTLVKQSLQERLDAVERELLLDALKSTRGNRAKAARILGVTERVIGLRVARFEIDPSRFKTKRKILQ